MESIIFSVDGRSYDKLFKLLKRVGKVTKGEISVQRFSDGENGVEFLNSVRGKRVYLLSSPNTSDKIIQLGLAIDAAKRSSAAEIIPILPFFPYSRSDKRDQTRGPIGARFIADLLEAAGATSIITFDLHADQIQGFFNIPVMHMEGKYIFDEYICNLYNTIGDIVLCSPDAGSSKRVKQFRDRITELTGIKLPIVHIDKSREVANEVSSMDLIGDVINKNVLILDDLIDTYGTADKAINLLIDSGAKSVYMVATHGILSGPAVERIKHSKVTELVISDTLDTNSKKVKVISCANQIVNAIVAINENISVESLKH